MANESHDNLVLKIGQLEGKTQAMNEEIHEVKADVRDVYKKLNDNTEILNRIDTKMGQAARDVERVQEQVEDLVLRPTASGITKTKAWDKPLGELMGDIFLQALKVVGVGAVVAVILWAVGNANLPQQTKPATPTTTNIP